MLAIDVLISVIWFSPLFYLFVMLMGKWFRQTRRAKLIEQRGPVQKKLDKIIFQIPTVGNYQTVNRIFETVRNYGISIPMETWVIVEERDANKDRYVCDRVVVVPRDFVCEDLYKARALEYARRLRVDMVARGELSPDYLLLQGDDDAVPTLGFIQESMTFCADITIGTITPKPTGVLSTLIDYERCVVCGIFCNFFTNLGQPLWAHGEGTVMSAKVDQAVSYDISPYTKNKDLKLISSEDAFYFHKAFHMGFSIYNSEERVIIIPPLTMGDAVKQRRRWFWGQWSLIKYKMLPLSNRLRLGFLAFSGLCFYFLGMVGVPLQYFGLLGLPNYLFLVMLGSLVTWFVMRGYLISAAMGWKHGLVGALLSYITVTLNACANLIGLIKGDPHNFEVIRKI